MKKQGLAQHLQNLFWGDTGALAKSAAMQCFCGVDGLISGFCRSCFKEDLNWLRLLTAAREKWLKLIAMMGSHFRGFSPFKVLMIGLLFWGACPGPAAARQYIDFGYTKGKQSKACFSIDDLRRFQIELGRRILIAHFRDDSGVIEIMKKAYACDHLEREDGSNPADEMRDGLMYVFWSTGKRATNGRPLTLFEAMPNPLTSTGSTNLYPTRLAAFSSEAHLRDLTKNPGKRYFLQAVDVVRNRPAGLYTDQGLIPGTLTP